jgi:hypothetical protein
MTCPSCGQRRARRDCPALGHSICAVCCGTKRRVEIRCPGDCPYLVSAREHPAAVTRRQQEHDVSRLIPSIRHLTERQSQLFFLLHTTIARHQPSGFGRLLDLDVADATASLAATLETSARGVIYEHPAGSAVSQALVSELKTVLGQIREQGARVFDHEVIVVLRAIEAGARAAGGPGTAGRPYLDLVGRLLHGGAPFDADLGKPESPLIVP